MRSCPVRALHACECRELMLAVVVGSGRSAKTESFNMDSVLTAASESNVMVEKGPFMLHYVEQETCQQCCDIDMTLSKL